MNPKEYEQITLMRDYQAVFKGKSTEQQGLRVLFDLLNKCGVFIVNTKNPHDAAILEGKRTIGIEIMRMVEMAPQYGDQLSPQHLIEFVQRLENAKNYHETIKHDSGQFKED